MKVIITYKDGSLEILSLAQVETMQYNASGVYIEQVSGESVLIPYVAFNAIVIS